MKGQNVVFFSNCKRFFQNLTSGHYVQKFPLAVYRENLKTVRGFFMLFYP